MGETDITARTVQPQIWFNKPALCVSFFDGSLDPPFRVDVTPNDVWRRVSAAAGVMLPLDGYKYDDIMSFYTKYEYLLKNPYFLITVQENKEVPRDTQKFYTQDFVKFTLKLQEMLSERGIISDE